jgi:hypothetical protein
MRTDFDQHWRELSDEVISGMKEWRLQHPRATFREIEAAVDERLARLRAWRVRPRIGPGRRPRRCVPSVARCWKIGATIGGNCRPTGAAP